MLIFYIMQLKVIKNSTWKGIALCIFILNFISCEKYEDKAKKDIDDTLTNQYCNITDAINYNWGFPGEPNDSLCIFPVEPFIAYSWTLIDTVLNEDMDILETRNRTIYFEEYTAIDTMKHMILMKDYCSENSSILLEANRHLLASVFDNMENDIGQLDCDGSSVLNGFISLDSLSADTLKLRFQKRTIDDLNLTINGRAYKNY